ncbi:hypothetical protein L2E82_25393 [Cichorium intybus]|uniref:Uncharacterized protein n=1 Tax=Cichorium intybus TaxID=13427 RepID=A0ACB9E4E9_CICIN|nr:hypothetical protein L2E82_25393 [Cichorium intybus]
MMVDLFCNIEKYSKLRFIIQQRQPLGYLQIEFVPSSYLRPIDIAEFLLDPCRIVATSEHGIIITESAHQKNNDLIVYHVCKPTTRQFQIIPNPKSKYDMFKAAIVIIGAK